MQTRQRVKQGKITPIPPFPENYPIPLRKCLGATMGVPDAKIEHGIDLSDTVVCPADGSPMSMYECDKLCGKTLSIRCRVHCVKLDVEGYPIEGSFNHGSN